MSYPTFLSFLPTASLTLPLKPSLSVLSICFAISNNYNKSSHFHQKHHLEKLPHFQYRSLFVPPEIFRSVSAHSKRSSWRVTLIKAKWERMATNTMTSKHKVKQSTTIDPHRFSFGMGLFLSFGYQVRQFSQFICRPDWKHCQLSEIDENRFYFTY
jgi:hypothetical protein